MKNFNKIGTHYKKNDKLKYSLIMYKTPIHSAQINFEEVDVEQEHREIESIEHFTNLNDISEKLNISYDTCLRIKNFYYYDRIRTCRRRYSSSEQFTKFKIVPYLKY